MLIGNIIKHHRIARDITQRELCNGICSISHLSKIENNNKEANTETIELLLARLGLTLADVERLSQQMDLKLKTFLRYIIYFDKAAAREAYTELIEKEEQIMLTENINKYHLYLYRYYLFIGDSSRALKQKKMLEPFIPVFSHQENQLYMYCDSILLMKEGEFAEALKTLTSFEKELPLPYILQGEFYYQIALVHSILGNSSSSINYAQKALNEFRSEYNYIRILHAQVLLAIEYTDLDLFEEADEQFFHLLRNVQIVHEHGLIGTIHHNYAILCEKKSEYDLALEHYAVAQEKPLNPQQYYISFCNLTEVLIKTGKRQEALKNVGVIIENTNTKSLRKYFLVFTFYRYILQDKTKKAYKFLEEELLPYLEKQNHTKDIKRFSLLLADFYADEHKEKAIKYYKISQK